MSVLAERLLQSHLWNDEQVLWQGQPIAAAPVAATAAREGFWRGLGTAIGLAVAGIVILIKLSPDFGTGFLKYGAIVGAIGLGGYVVWSAVYAGLRGRRLAGSTVYAITNRRVVMVQGEEERWVGIREIADVRTRGSDVVVERKLTDAELRWRASSANLEDQLADTIAVGREVVIAGVPEPARVVALLQTLQHPAAS